MLRKCRARWRCLASAAANFRRAEVELAKARLPPEPFPSAERPASGKRVEDNGLYLDRAHRCKGHGAMLGAA